MNEVDLLAIRQWGVAEIGANYRAHKLREAANQIQCTLSQGNVSPIQPYLLTFSK